jgi:hypothetical protein
MAHNNIHKHTVCSKYKGTQKKLLVVCRKCELRRNCNKFLLSTYPDLAFIDLNLARTNYLSKSIQ